MKKVGEYVLMNDEKVHRAINGSLSRNGLLSGGVGEDAADDALLGEYDRLGGLVMKNDLKVKSGSFYNYKTKKRHEEPQVAFMINVDGENIEGTEEEAAGLKAARDRIKEMKGRKNKSEDTQINSVVEDDEEAPVVKTKRSKKLDE